MDQATESADLKDVRYLLQKEKIDPDHAVEYFLPAEQVEPLKQQIRAATQNHCYFFTRPEDDQVHMIAIVNVEGIADLFDQIKGEKSTAILKSQRLAEGAAKESLDF